MEITANLSEKEIELERQFGFCQRVREIVNEKYGYKPLAFVHTYGCQQNVSDSEKLKGWLSLMGYTFCDSPENADLVLFNTCAVREHAELKALSNTGQLKHIKEKNPDANTPRPKTT